MIRLRVLGGLDLACADERPVSDIIAQPKRTALLVFLALKRRGGMHRRDTLLALFWPDSTDERARNSLSQSLSIFRRCIPGVLHTRGFEEVGVDRSAIECDALLFEDAIAGGREAEALTLYSGDLLPGFNLSGLTEFERWLESERLRLRAAAVDAGLSLSNQALLAGRFTDAKKWAATATALAPDDERALRATLEVFDKSGDRSAAIRSYEDFARQLRAEYEIEPSPETRSLLARIRTRGGVSPRVESAPAESNGGLESRSALDGTESLSFLPFQLEAEGFRNSADALPRAKPQSSRLQPLAAAGVVTISLILLLAATTGIFRKTYSTSAEPISAASRIVAVPFENRTGDSSLTRIGAVAADWITQGLLETRLLNVVDGTIASAAAKNLSSGSDHFVKPSAALAEETHARLAVTGSVVRNGDSIALQASVTDLRTGDVLAVTRPVWALSTAAIGAVARVRDLVVGALAGRLDERLASQAAGLSSQRPPTLPAYKEYITGLEVFFDSDYPEAVRHFSEASREDSTFILPLVWSMISYGTMGDDGKLAATIGALRRRSSEVSRADRLGAEYYSARLRGDYLTQLRVLRTAAELAPQSVWAWDHALVASDMNRPLEALAELRRLDPEHGWLKGLRSEYYAEMASNLHVIGDYDGEIDASAKAAVGGHRAFDEFMELRGVAAAGRFEEVRARLPLFLADTSFRGPLACLVAELRTHHYPLTPQEIAMFVESDRKALPRTRFRESFIRLLYETRNYSEAARTSDDYMKTRPPSVMMVGLRAAIALRLGDRKKADSLSAILEGMPEKDTAVPGRPAFWEARFASIRGDTAAAFAHLKRAYALGYPRLPGYSDPGCTSDLDALRAYQPFRAMAKEGLHP